MKRFKIKPMEMALLEGISFSKYDKLRFQSLLEKISHLIFNRIWNMIVFRVRNP